MTIYSNIIEKDLINLPKLAEQQKEQRALKIKNRFLKQTHDIKIAESLSPITKKLDESTKKINEELGNVIKESNTPQPAIENTPQPAIENTPSHQPIENNEGVIYDVELENTLKNMKENIGFIKTHEDPQRGWILNDYPVKMLRGTEVEINDRKYDKTPGIQKVCTDATYNTAKSRSDMEKLVFRDILQKTDYYKRLPTKGRMSGRDRYTKNDLDNDVRRILNLDTKLKGRGIEKNYHPFKHS